MSGIGTRVIAGNRRLAIMYALLALPLGIATARQVGPSPTTSPATGHAQVVTQGIAELPSEPMVWRLVERTAQPRWNAKAGGRVNGFVLATDEPVLLTNVDADGRLTDVARLAAGESYFVVRGTRQVRASMSDQSVSYLTLELVPADDAGEIGNGTLLFTTPSFTPPPGSRDIDLVGNALANAETAEVPDSGQPLYILATDGAVDILPASGERTRLEAGESGIFTGPLDITAVEPSAGTSNSLAFAGLTAPLKRQVENNAGSGYIVAVIGVEIPPVQTPTPIPTETPTQPPAETPANQPITGSTGEQPVSDPTPTPTEEPPPDRVADSDRDGLANDLEPQYGTSPRDPDSDADGLSDGDEVLVYGTNPTSRDTDSDGLDDYSEVIKYGTNPSLRDSDGDQVTDGREIATGRDPLDPDG